MDARAHTEALALPFPPAGDGSAVPYGVFTDPAVYALEQERLYRGPTWNFLALSAELPQPGDFKSTFVGDTPVVVTRDVDGSAHAWVNRCAHRGALVCRELRGHNASGTHTCVYHQWSFNHRGELVGVPFRKGLGGKGGYPDDFRLQDHGLVRLKVEEYRGVVFGSFDAGIEPVADYLGRDSAIQQNFERVFHRPLEVIGHARQYIHGNWKIYAENIKDPYHASLLHLFHMTFGLYRSSQQGGVEIARDWHSVLWSRSGTDSSEDITQTRDAQLRTYQEGSYSLADPSLLAGRREFDDGITLVILAVYPSLVVQQIQNTLAVRQILPKGPDAFELVWTFFGYADDDPELRAIRLKQINLIGPAGLISMEDGEAVEIVQRAVVREQATWSCIEMGGRDARSQSHLVTEAPIRGMWRRYREVLGL